MSAALVVYFDEETTILGDTCSRLAYTKQQVVSSHINHIYSLREFVKTSVILTPGALLVGCEPQFVLHFAGIAGIWGCAQKLYFEH